MSAATDTPYPGDAEAEYKALGEHCVTCADCRANPEVVCPVAEELRREWSIARRIAPTS